MKRDKLYTVTKGNKRPISRGISERNLFSIGGLKAEAQAYKSANPWDFADDKGLVDQYINTDAYLDTKGGLFNMTRRNNPFSRGNLQPGGMGADLLGAAGTAVNQGALKLIGGDYETGGVGEGIASVGNTVGSIVGKVNPAAGLIVQAATGIIGGGVNRTFGIATNEENLAKANAAIATGKGFKSNATTMGGLKATPAFASVGRVYKGGWARKGAGNRKDADIHTEVNDAVSFADRSVENNRLNIASDNLNDQLAVSSAFGGPIDRINYNDMGAIEYGFMSDYLTNKKRQVEAQNKLPGISPATSTFGKGGCLCNTFALGGDGDNRNLRQKAKDWSKKHTPDWWNKPIVQLIPEWMYTSPLTHTLKNKQRNNYNGGSFHGSGAGGSWDEPYIPKNNKTFNDAFDEARNAGAEDFVFGDKIYNTIKEANPVREFNNRIVGAGRTEDVVRRREGYGKDFGPIQTQEAVLPVIPYGLGGTLFALGGDIQTNGADWSTGAAHIDEGGTHEENPNEGIQVGVDPEGTPNLVEEGEVIYNDYVYSNRIELNDEAKEVFHISKKRKITYADMVKKLEKEISERPNDPISKAAFSKQMQDLADQQERQKQEMEAEKAQQAFDALTPEEQVEVMNYAGQRQQAEEAAMQEQAMAQQAMAQKQMAAQQPMQEVPQEAMQQEQMAVPVDGNVNAEGGQLNQKNLFPWGGIENLFNIDPRYTPSNTVGFIPYDRSLAEEEVLKREQDPTFRAWTDYVNSNWLADDVMSYLKALDAAAGGNHLFDKNGNLTKDAKDYFNKARTQNHKWGYYHLTPNYTDDIQQLINQLPSEEQMQSDYNLVINNPNGVTSEILNNQSSGKIHHAVEGDDEYLQGDPSTWNIGKETRRVTLPNGEVVIYHAPGNLGGKDGMTFTEGQLQQAGNNVDGINGWDVEPNYRNENLRYAGLLGPAVGLGLMAAGVGKPDKGAFDAVLNTYDGSGLALADYRPLGNYMTYRPMDMWAEQNRMNANARATDRALSNTSSPSRAAGLLANAYNNQVASGQLYRQGLEYNNNLNERVQTYNRQTDQYNADAYNRVALANTDAINRDRQYRAQLGMSAAAQKADMDAGWYNSLYGNVGGIFKGLADVGRENAQHNMIAEMAANGLFGQMSPNTKVGRKGKYLTFTPTYVAKKGGKLNRKKGGK